MKPEPGSRQVLLVVSPANEETRPIVAANLGATYAEAGQRAIVVSTDDLDSGFAPVGGRPQPGPIGPEVVAAYLQPSSLPNVMRLSFRHFIASSGQLVNLAPEVLDSARQLADVIIVESPPFLESHHGEALVHAVDAVLVVVESRTTTIDQGKRTGILLRRIGAPVLGVVLTNVAAAASALLAGGGAPASAGRTLASTRRRSPSSARSSPELTGGTGPWSLRRKPPTRSPSLIVFVVLIGISRPIIVRVAAAEAKPWLVSDPHRQPHPPPVVRPGPDLRGRPLLPRRRRLGSLRLPRGEAGSRLPTPRLLTGPGRPAGHRQ